LNLPPLDASDLPPLPPLPPIISSDNLAKDTGASTSNANPSALPPLPSGLPESASGSASNMAAAKDVAKTQTPDFGLAIPSGANALGTAKPASESPSLSAATNLPTNLPSTDLLPKLPGAESTASNSTTPTANAPVVASRAYENARTVANDQAAKGQLKDALATLSVFYNSADLTDTQRVDLLDFLDALAAVVIYSTEHHLDLPYTSAAGESLEQIARRFQVPTEVLAKINGLEPTTVLQSGTKLKIVPGPFRAEVDLKRNELTLFLGELYASRFPISTGSDPNPQPGSYSVVAKDRNRNYYGSGAPIMATDANNPYGGYLIDLGNQISIHGSASNSNDKLGCISLSPSDVADVYGMLSSGSQVTIRR
jgi:lipoprotein-anchoring transpeptidase ErfK/SrfK